jgi:hypothetical protein
MVTSEDDNAIHIHRAEALERAAPIATSNWDVAAARS